MRLTETQLLLNSLDVQYTWVLRVFLWLMTEEEVVRLVVAMADEEHKQISIIASEHSVVIMADSIAFCTEISIVSGMIRLAVLHLPVPTERVDE